MLGVEGYGSGSDSDNDDDIQQPSTSTLPPPKKPTPSSSSAAPKKSGLSLPPPSASTSSAGLALPPPKKKVTKKKITIGLPSLPVEDEKDDLDARPPAKKPRLEAGAGTSALLSMLPAPKNKNLVPVPHERVLGGGRGPGLVFHTGSKAKWAAQQATVEDADNEEEEEPTNVAPISNSILEEVEEAKESTASSSSLPFLPPSLAKGKANINTEERHTMPKSAAVKASLPAVDFFSLGSVSESASPTPPPAAPSLPSTSTFASTSILPLPPVSSAPKIEDFVPPEPTPQDPYPGYYLLPSGAWAAYDAAYYQSFYKKWQKAYDAHVRALEKGVEKGFEGMEAAGAQTVDPVAEMEKAKREVQEREEKKALTAGGQHTRDAPKMNIKGAALSGRAKGRHQLTTLLSEAYANREALEERIAQGRRNRKEAGNKYGF